MKQMKTMMDAMGNAIPVKYVASYDKERDRIARRIKARFDAARKMLEKTVTESVADLESLRGKKEKLGEKGNFAAQSFDGLIRVAIRQQYAIRLDERVAEARDIMLKYVNGVLDRVTGVDVSALRLLVEAAFKSNSRGYLSAGKVLSLLRMEVNNTDWRHAKELLQAALQPVKGKQYLQCETRPTTQRDFVAIRLDAADCWPQDGGQGTESPTTAPQD